MARLHFRAPKSFGILALLNVLFASDIIHLVISAHVTLNNISDTGDVSGKHYLKPYLDGSVSINTCCPLDLGTESARCMKLSPGEEVIPSANFTIPKHLMAENDTYSFNLLVQHTRECAEGDEDTVFMSLNDNPSRSVFFLKNGYLKVANHYYHKDEYCINGRNGSILELSVCPQNCKGPRPCIVKCCGLHQVYSLGFPLGQVAKKGCQVPDTSYFSPLLYQDFDHVSTNSAIPPPHYIEKYPSAFKYECPNNKTTMTMSYKTGGIFTRTSGFKVNTITFRLGEDGSIFYRDTDGSCKTITDLLGTNKCVDGAMNFGSDILPFTNRPEEFVLFQCISPLMQWEESEGSVAYGTLMMVSSIFLLLTIAVYFMLWERQTVHGWTILSHTISMFFMYIFLGASHLSRAILGNSILNTTMCHALGMLAHYFFLSTFCWLSMISIDLWLTFKAFVPRGTKSKGYKRYTMYSVLGWGIPAAIVTTGIVLTRDQGLETCVTAVRPGYAIESCYLQEKAQKVYVYYPIAAMMLVNVVFFIITSVNLYMYQKSTRMARNDNDDTQQFYRLFFKLFFVMGVLYIFELVSSIYSGIGIFWYWAFFDSINILRAVAVFIIFVCKNDIIWALEKKYTWLKPIFSACIIVRRGRNFSQRRAESESIALNSSLSTKQSTIVRRNNLD